MKRTLRLVGMAAMVLLLAASCKKDEKNASENEEGLVMMTFGAGIEQNNGAKTGLIPEGTIGSDYHLKQIWLSSDRINVNGTSYGFSKYVGDSKQVAEFSGLGKPASDYYAIYHGENSNATLHYDKNNPDATTADFTIPTQQSVTKKMEDGKTMYVPQFIPMAAKCASGSNQLMFKNLCGLLEVRLYSAPGLKLTVDNIRLGVNAAGEYISGKWTYNFKKDAFVRNPGTTSDINMNFTEKVTISNEKDNPTSFFFVLPPVTASKNFNIFISGNDVSGGAYVTVTHIANADQPVGIDASYVSYNTTAIELSPMLVLACTGAYINGDSELSSDIPNNALYCTGEFTHVNFPQGIEVDELGFCVVKAGERIPEWNEIPGNPNYHDSGSTSANFAKLVENLEYSTQYEAHAYVRYKYAGSVHTEYQVYVTDGHILKTTPAEPGPGPDMDPAKVEFSEDNAVEITDEGVTFRFNLTPNGHDILQYGVCIGESENPICGAPLGASESYVDEEEGILQVPNYELELGKIYHVRAYVTLNGEDPVYSEDMMFTTPAPSGSLISAEAIVDEPFPGYVIVSFVCKPGPYSVVQNIQFDGTDISFGSPETLEDGKLRYVVGIFDYAPGHYEGNFCVIFSAWDQTVDDCEEIDFEVPSGK